MLTCKTRDIDHKIEITKKKINHDKLQNPIFNKPNVEG